MIYFTQNFVIAPMDFTANTALISAVKTVLAQIVTTQMVNKIQRKFRVDLSVYNLIFLFNEEI